MRNKKSDFMDIYKKLKKIGKILKTDNETNNDVNVNNILKKIQDEFNSVITNKDQIPKNVLIDSISVILENNELNPRNLSDLYLKRGILKHSNKNKDAISDLKISSDIYPSSLAYYNLGLIYHEIRNFDDALISFYKSLESAKGKGFEFVSEVYYARGSVFLELRKHADAFIDFSQAIKWSKGYSEYFNARAVTLAHLGKFEDAIWNLECAKKCNDYDKNKDVGTSHNIATILMIQGKFNESLPHMNNAKKNIENSLNENNTDISKNNISYVYQFLALNYIGLGEYEKAINIIDNNLEVDIFSLELSALAYNGLRKYDKAILSLEKCIENEIKEVNSKWLLFHNLKVMSIFGSTHRLKSENDSAIIYYNKALEIYKQIQQPSSLEILEIIRTERGLQKLGITPKTDYTYLAENTIFTPKMINDYFRFQE